MPLYRWCLQPKGFERLSGPDPKRYMQKTKCLGLGTAWLGSASGADADEIAVATIRTAIDQGIGFIDTAPAYGQGERRTGMALSDGYRDRVHLTTKTDRDYSGSPGDIATRIRRTFEQSLRALRTDRVDLLLIHDAPNADVIFKRGAALDTVLRLKEEGAAGAVGLGLRDLSILRAGIETGCIDAVLTFLWFNLLEQSAAKELLPLATSHGVRVVNGSPLGMGLLVDDFDRRQSGLDYLDPGGLKRTELRRWAHANGLTLQALALHYSLAEPRIHVTLTGSRSLSELEQALACVASPQPPELWVQLEADLGVPAPRITKEGLVS